MNLFVRSQDKTKLVKINEDLYVTYNILGIVYEEEILQENRPYCIKGGISILGFYATKERALEVLDEIQRLLEKDKFEEDRYCCDKLTKAIVYEMPKK